MEKIGHLLLSILLLVVSSAEVKSFDTLYSSKEECLQKNVNGQDKEMVTSLCSSLVYPPSRKEQTEILKKQQERDRQWQETYDDAVERNRSIKQKELEKDPANGVVFFKQLAATLGNRLLESYKTISPQSE